MQAMCSISLLGWQSSCFAVLSNTLHTSLQQSISCPWMVEGIRHARAPILTQRAVGQSPMRASKRRSASCPSHAQDDLTILIEQQLNYTYLVRNLSTGDPSERAAVATATDPPTQPAQ